jgi:hypothetical protein
MSERRILNLEFHCPQLKAAPSVSFSGEEVNRWPKIEKMAKLDIMGGLLSAKGTESSKCD